MLQGCSNCCAIFTKRIRPLLVFVDSLVMLNILQHWEKANFNPDPNDAVHFDVILPLLEALCQRPHLVRLMKEKSHEKAELGYDDTAQEICPAPQILDPWR